MADTSRGGLPAAKDFKRLAGSPNVLFLGDLEINPLGLKSRAFATEVARSWFDFARGFAKAALIVPCNTASIAGTEVLKTLSQEHALPVVTTLDALERLLQRHGHELCNRRVAVMGTQSTIASGVYQAMLQETRPLEIISIVGTNSERIVAAGVQDFAQRLEAVRMDLVGSRDFDVLVLACSCFVHLKAELQTIAAHPLEFLDPSELFFELAQKRLPLIHGTSQLFAANTGKEATDKPLREGCAEILPQWHLADFFRWEVAYEDAQCPSAKEAEALETALVVA